MHEAKNRRKPVNKVIPIVGLVVFLLVIGIWLSRPTPTGVVAQGSDTTTEETTEDSSDTTEDESMESESSESETSEMSEESSSDAMESENMGEGDMSEEHSDDMEEMMDAEALEIPEGFTATALLSEEQIQDF